MEGSLYPLSNYAGTIKKILIYRHTYNMDLKQILKKKKGIIIEKWFQATIDTYPAQTAKVLGKKSDRFDNPIGAITHETIENVFNLIIEDYTPETLENILDPIIRIRAVQSFCASEAVSFVFALKQIGETQIEEKMLREFDKLVDQIALASFNRFMKCKEEIYLLKANEGKRRVHRAFERAGLVAELEEQNVSSSKNS
jgi:hypothetical protein